MTLPKGFTPAAAENKKEAPKLFFLAELICSVLVVILSYIELERIIGDGWIVFGFLCTLGLAMGFNDLAKRLGYKLSVDAS